MEKIALISTGYLWFPCESGTVRMYEVASAIREAGYEIDTIVPDFQHHSKSPRDKEKILEQNYPFNIYFAKALPYKKNISLARIRSNKLLKKSVEEILLSHIHEYQAVLLSIPPNNVAASVAKICHEHRVPLLVDVEDLWPRAMEMVLGDNIISKIALSGFERDARYVYTHCDGVIGTSPDYRDKAFEYIKKDMVRKIPNDVIYVGCDIDSFDAGVKEYSHEIEKPKGEIWVTYAGSISNSYDIATLVQAGELISKDKNTGIHINILGNGTNKAELEAYVKEKNIGNISFWGFTPYRKMAAVLSRSDMLINSFVKNAPQSIVNKVADYLAAGKPIINTLENPVFCRLIDENEIGINIPPGDVVALKNAIISLALDEGQRSKMGTNARTLCLDSFDSKKCNEKVISVLERCMENGKANYAG